ncbi:hypothetical protein [Phytoactinopolyspora mesophila]|uniref:Uncharacterized protein n=1 Tax=Phytoactinopolyspora mesophila TaxID=2650750 RepID=A0A7K3M452_9ACTN|nr:hypothetical protein [Phytoactinopolyspora mesophila]NDL57817.1 hypothetical protein [Phytoactinopolyspora mesophila]
MLRDWWDTDDSALPPVKLNLDDLEDIVRSIEADLECHARMSVSGWGPVSSAAEIASLHEADIEWVSIQEDVKLSGFDGDPRISLHLGRQSVHAEGTGEATRAALGRVRSLSRRRVNARGVLSLAALFYWIAVIALPVWFVVDVGPDWRLIPVLAGGIAGAVWLGEKAKRWLQRRGMFRNAGVKIVLLTRQQERDRRYLSRRDSLVYFGGIVTGIIGALVTAWLVR